MKNIVKNLKVWSLIHGQGFVKNYDGKIILCRFGNLDVEFTENGRLPNLENYNQVLFFSEPQISALKTPPFISRFSQNEQIIVSHNRDGLNGQYITVGFENEFCVTTSNGKDYPKNEFFFFKIGERIIMD